MLIPIEIIITLLGASLTGLGFLVVVVMNAFTKNTEAFEKINGSIESIRIWMGRKDAENEFETRNCSTMHQQINNRFERNENSIENHEKRLIELEK
jgi:hypothetical protein